MTLYQSSELLSKRIAPYNRIQEESFFSLRDHDNHENEDAALTSLISKVCTKILHEHPELVANSSLDKGQRHTLTELIMKYAEQLSLRAGLYRHELQRQVIDSLFGYGPIQYLIDDPDISDIDAVSPYEITVKKNGIRMRVSTSFEGEAVYEAFCRLLIIRQGGLINENDNHCRVTDHENRLRINITVPPRSLKHSSLSIRKHPPKAPTLTDLAEAGMFSSENISYLEHLAASDFSFLICGKGGSGKTTLLRSLINVMPPLERVLIAESDAEIYAEKACCLSQRIRKVNEGGRPVSLRDLVSDGLTMSLDTYCIGEIVGEEAYEFIRAAYSGHRCLATVHAISATDALDRIISLASTARGGEQERTLKNMLARSIDVVIYLDAYRIEQVVEVKDYDKEKDTYTFQSVKQRFSAASGSHYDISFKQMVSS